MLVTTEFGILTHRFSLSALSLDFSLDLRLAKVSLSTLFVKKLSIIRLVDPVVFLFGSRMDLSKDILVCS